MLFQTFILTHLKTLLFGNDWLERGKGVLETDFEIDLLKISL